MDQGKTGEVIISFTYDLQTFRLSDFQTLMPIFFMSSEALKLEQMPGVRR